MEARVHSGKCEMFSIFSAAVRLQKPHVSYVSEALKPNFCEEATVTPLLHINEDMLLTRDYLINKNYSVNKAFTCFLIDDDADDQEIFLRVLESVAPAVECHTASNGQEAIDKLRNRQVKPDVIFLDLNMPLMNGKQFLQACQGMGSCKEIPVIILSTSSDQQTIRETRELGASDYITKPNRYSAWKEVIQEKLRTVQTRGTA